MKVSSQQSAVTSESTKRITPKAAKGATCNPMPQHWRTAKVAILRYVSPYSLPGSLGSAFDAVTPGSNANRVGGSGPGSEGPGISSGAGSIDNGPRSLSSSPRPRASSNSPPTRPISMSPTTPPSLLKRNNSPSELKSIEKMVNGLEVQHNGNGGSTLDELQRKSPSHADQ
ncbi:optomotor-blind protein-like [Teleopsis dalmanni]|uniref:optomotor-blind protein-like n=1 Tax=Teleopsis dalmanni TaxID=139649 RepID=UPI0018CEBEF2|nr:optomotor-blind protein-like [Teleopsis dalmanni]